MLRRIALGLLLASCAAPTAAPAASAPLSPTPLPSAQPPTAASAPPLAAEGARADIDGDGRADEVSVEGDRPESAGSAVVTAVLGRGATLALTLAEASDPVIVFVGDVDTDGRDEIFVRVWRGASTEFLAIVAFDGTRLVRVDESGSSEPLRIALDGSVTHGDGLECRFPAGGPAELVLLSYSAREAPGLRESVYVWRGKTLVLRDVRTDTFREELRERPEFRRYYTFACEARSALR